MKELSVTLLQGYPEKYPSGSIFKNEGIRLYELVKKYKPKKIIEVGTRFGCSTQFLAFGCLENGFGEVHTYDIEDHYLGHNPIFATQFDQIIKRHLHSYFDEPNKVCDMLFEDGAHTWGFTSKVLEETTATMVIAVHDYCHWDCLGTVRDESTKVLGAPNEVFLEKPSDCGLGIWVK